ncbi:hypothetical protein KKG22_02575 [Patescibacteria group bacterium]|nr:hypothetical protein [Patescibacteria group bacterium]MBU1722187.1 hypothetical protein [Patescibacteria group bacterium]MBU1901138.1 hypothetical protein [Patescibacteria group bacterium]
MDRDLAECITCETFTPGGCATSENVACLDVLEEDDLTVILCFSNQLVNGNVDFLQCLTHPEQYGENTEEDTSPEEIPCENRAKQHARDHFETCLNADTYENGDAPTELECLNQASEVSDRYIEMFCKDTDESMEA